MAEFPIAQGVNDPAPMHKGGGPDAADWLASEAATSEAADKLIRLRQHVADAYAQIPKFAQQQELAEAKTASEVRIAQLLKPRTQSGFGLDEAAQQVIDERKKLTRAAAALTRHRELDDIRSAKWAEAGRVVKNVEAFLAPGGGIPSGYTVEVCEVEAPKVKGGNIIEAIERERHRVRELKADRHRVESSPFPSAHTKRRMREAVDQLAQRGAPSVSRLIEQNGDIEWPDVQHRIPVITDRDAAIATLILPDALAFQCWLHHDEIIKRLDVEIDAESDDKIALSEQQRAEQIRQIEHDILEHHERAECELIWQAWSQGISLEFRADTSPLAILGLKFKLIAAPRVERDGTSPEHGFSIAGLLGRR